MLLLYHVADKSQELDKSCGTLLVRVFMSCTRVAVTELMSLLNTPIEAREYVGKARATEGRMCRWNHGGDKLRDAPHCP